MTYAFAKKLIPCSDGLSELLIVPDGLVDLVGDPSITMNQEAADRCIKLFNEKGLQIPVDYEHSSVFEASKGKPAPATAWITKLRYEPGRGLIGVLGDRSKEFDALVTTKGYKYLSPVIHRDPDTGDVIGIHSVGLTNKPKIKNQKELLAASQRLTLAEMPDDKEPPKHEDGEGDLFMDAIKKMAEALRGYGVQLADESPEQVMNAAMQWMVNKQQSTQTTAAFSEKVTVALGIAKDAAPDLILAEVGKLKGHVGFVPAAEFKALSDRMAVIETEKKAATAESLVVTCLGEGKLNPNDAEQMKWARECALRDGDGFKLIMSSAPVIHPMGRTAPVAGATNKDANGVVTREKVIALSEKEFNDDPTIRRMNTKREWVNGSLREHGFELLKADKN